MIVLDDFDLFMAKILLDDAAVIEEYPLQKIIEFFAFAREGTDQIGAKICSKRAKVGSNPDR